MRTPLCVKLRTQRGGREPDSTERLHFHFSLSCIGEGNGNPLQCSCLENPGDRGAWRAAVHGVARSRTRLSDFTLFFHFHALEKEMATHSSVLAWRILGTGEPGGLPSMGSHRVVQPPTSYPQHPDNVSSRVISTLLHADTLLKSKRYRTGT